MLLANTILTLAVPLHVSRCPMITGVRQKLFLTGFILLDQCRGAPI